MKFKVMNKAVRGQSIQVLFEPARDEKGVPLSPVLVGVSQVKLSLTQAAAEAYDTGKVYDLALTAAN